MVLGAVEEQDVVKQRKGISQFIDAMISCCLTEAEHGPTEWPKLFGLVTPSFGAPCRTHHGNAQVSIGDDSHKVIA